MSEREDQIGYRERARKNLTIVKPGNFQPGFNPDDMGVAPEVVENAGESKLLDAPETQTEPTVIETPPVDEENVVDDQTNAADAVGDDETTTEEPTERVPTEVQPEEAPTDGDSEEDEDAEDADDAESEEEEAEDAEGTEPEEEDEEGVDDTPEKPAGVPDRGFVPERRQFGE